jgi:hypothetical protein
MIASAKRARAQITTVGATRYGIKRARGRHAGDVLCSAARAFVAKNNAGCAGAVPWVSDETRAEDRAQCRVQIVGCVSVVLPEIPAKLRQQTAFCRIIRPILDMLRITGIGMAD